MVFQFEHISLDQIPGKDKWDLKVLDLVDLKRVLSKWQTCFDNNGWNSLFWNNHDLPRVVSRWGNDQEYRVESAKMLATLLHGMKGTPYIYQGEELGMTNVRFSDLSGYMDIETLNMYRERLNQGYSHENIMESIYAKGRDNARTPMQWTTELNGGFSAGIPWIGINPNYKMINAKNQVNDDDSIFSHYKKLIRLRRENDVIVYGDFELLFPNDENIFAYTRTLGQHKLVVICNFYGKNTPYKLPYELNGKKAWELSNYNDCRENLLRPYEGIMYLLA
jgi:glycosidase